MPRQIERIVHSRPIAKNGVLPVTTLFFWKFYFSIRISDKELIWCSNYQMPRLMPFVSAGVLLEGAFSLWVSLNSGVLSRHKIFFCITIIPFYNWKKTGINSSGIAQKHASQSVFFIQVCIFSSKPFPHVFVNY